MRESLRASCQHLLEGGRLPAEDELAGLELLPKLESILEPLSDDINRQVRRNRNPACTRSMHPV